MNAEYGVRVRNVDAPLIDELPEETQTLLTGRHRSVREVAQFLANAHQPPHIQALTDGYITLLNLLLRANQDSPELTVAIRKLVESKDAGARQRVVQAARG